MTETPKAQLSERVLLSAITALGATALQQLQEGSVEGAAWFSYCARMMAQQIVGRPLGARQRAVLDGALTGLDALDDALASLIGDGGTGGQIDG